MSKFTDLWKVKMHKQGREERIKAIDARFEVLRMEMAKKVDPTRWNMLLSEMEELGKERDELIVMTGPFKDQTDVI